MVGKYDLPVALVVTGGDSRLQAEDAAVGNLDNRLSGGHYLSTRLCRVPPVVSLRYNSKYATHKFCPPTDKLSISCLIASWNNRLHIAFRFEHIFFF